MTGFEPFINLKSIREHLADSSESAIYHWIKPVSDGGKGLPVHRIAGRLAFRISEVNLWVETQGESKNAAHESDIVVDMRKQNVETTIQTSKS